MDFDSWLKTDLEFNSNLESGNSDCEWAAKFMRKAFEAGQQSKQTEIDALKAKIEEIEKWAEFHIEDYKPSESDSEHDRGWFHATCKVLKKLKGE